MAPRPFTDQPMVLEDEQTGDGRLFVAGCFTWADMPLPLRWCRMDEPAHGGAVQIGLIESMRREGNAILASGFIDDENLDGAELVRRLDAGSAPHGNRVYVSVDPDDWAVEIVDTNPETVDEADELMASVSGRAAEGSTLVDYRPGRALVAAAGDPDTTEGVVLFATSADEIIERYTHCRLRGATCLDIPAFAGAFLQLDGPAASAEDEGEPPEDAMSAAAGGIVVHEPDLVDVPVAPPAAWFENPALPMPAPLTITDQGRVLGHVAAWGTCHTGYEDRCVTPPRGGSYGNFRVGHVVCDDDTDRATGSLTWGIPHADLDLTLMAAFAHYADSRHGWADVACGEDDHGIWVSGALRPGLLRSDLRVLRSLSLSGDWRRDPRTGRLEMIAALAVNVPGFPIPRGLTASVGPLATVDRPEIRLVPVSSAVNALVAAGVVPQARPCNCGDGLVSELLSLDDSEMMGLLRTLERRTRHLLPDAVAAAAQHLH